MSYRHGSWHLENSGAELGVLDEQNLVDCDYRMNWKSADLFPAYSGNRWAVYAKGQITECDFAGVKAALKNWRPQSLILVAQPDSATFNTPIMFDKLTDYLRRGVLWRSLLALAVPVALAVGYLVLFLREPETDFLIWSAAYSIAAMWIGTESYFYLYDRRAVDERIRFLYWNHNRGSVRTGGAVAAVILLFVGGGQLIANHLGGFDETFFAVGVMYEDVRAGEYWRLLPGPYLHYSSVHFFVNAALLIFISTISWGALRPTIWIVTFLVGNTLGAWIQMEIGPQELNSCGGISFGIYALIGAMIGSAASTERVPRSLALILLLLALAAILLTEVTSPAAATHGHFGGLVAGVIIGLALAIRRKLEFLLHPAQS